MIECEHCESLIPEHYYPICPSCGAKLDLKNRIRFKQPKEQPRESKEDRIVIIHSDIEDFTSNDTDSSSI